MIKETKTVMEAEGLRRKAEEEVASQSANAGDSGTKRPLHELQVHQIELEMQNDKLRRAQVELEELRARYFDLYDLEPVAYLTLSEKEQILEANLTAAILLGMARSAMVNLPEEKVIDLYKGQGLCEQVHSELKSEMEQERLPSGKFAINALVKACGAMSYNILRFIGQSGLLGERSPVRHPAKRRRIKTVIQELINLAGRIIAKGRRVTIRLSRHCPGFDVFEALYVRFAYE
jgi:hypothetical protein